MSKKLMAQVQRENMVNQFPLLSPIPFRWSWLMARGWGEVAEPQSKSHIAPQELTSHRIDASVGIQEEKQVVEKDSISVTS